MNRVPICLLTVVFIAMATAQQPAAQRKVIHDPAEYNTYMSAIQQPSPQAKAQAVEGFVQQYPNSVVKEEALEQLLAAYQQAANQVNAQSPALAGVSRRASFAGKMTDTANRLLDVNPNNIRALALLVYLKQAQAKTASDPQQAAQFRGDAADLAKRGLNAVTNTQKPAGMSDDDFAKLISGVTTIFNGALAPTNQPNGQELPTLLGSKDWTPTSIEIRQSSVVDTRGDVQARAIVAGQKEILLCNSSCATLQPGTYNAEVKKGEIRIVSTSMTNGKQYKSSFRISGTW